MKIKLPILFFAFCLFSSSLFAQAKTFNVGVDFTPNYSFYTGDHTDVFTQRENNYTKKASFSFGVVLSYQLNNRWSVESGVKYTNRGHKGKREDYYYFYSDVHRSSLTTIQSPESTLIENYNYLSVPLNVRFSLNNNCNKGWYIRFGLSSDFYLSNKARYTFIDDEGKKRKEETEFSSKLLNKRHLNLNYGVGYSFFFREDYELSIEPVFEYMFYDLYKMYRDFTYNSVGVKFRFMVL